MQIKTNIGIIKIDCEYKKLIKRSEITRHPLNNNIHSIAQIKAFSNYLEKHGVWRVPLIISNLTGKLVSGHGRLDLAIMINMELLPVVFQDFDSEAAEYIFLTSDNEITKMSQFDERVARQAVEEIEGLKVEDMPFEFDAISYDVPEYANPIQDRETKKEKHSDQSESVHEEEKSFSGKNATCPECGQDL